MKTHTFSLITTCLIALATFAPAQTTPTLLFKDEFNAANGTSLTDPATRATGTLASTVKYGWTGTANLTTQDVVVDGTLNWDSNGNRDGLHRQSGDTSVQNFRMTYDWAPQVAGRLWEVEFDQRVANANPLTFGLSDSAQDGSWFAWNNTNYDFAASSFVRSLYYDTDNDDGGTGTTNPTQVVNVFPLLDATGPPSNQMHHFRIRFDEPNGTATVWINGVQKAQVTSLDFENAGRYLSWGEPNTYAGALDNITVSVFETPPTIVSYSPDQAATGAYPAAPLVATFSNAITLTGAGSITIKDMAGTNDITINVTDPAQVSVSGTNLIITPPARLAYGTPFKVVIGSGTVTNFSTEPTDDQWTFTTAVQGIFPTVVFKDDFNAANGTSLTDPATRATGTLASTVKYGWTGTANLTTQDVVVDGTLNWDSNGNRDGLHRQSGDTSVQNFRMTYNWAPLVNGRVWEVEFDQRVAVSHPLTFGLSDNVQNGAWDAWNNANYDFAAGSYGNSLYYDTDNDGGSTNPTRVTSVFPDLLTTNPPSNQIHRFRIRFDEPNGTATVWINGVQKAQVTSLDFENAGRYLSWGEPNTYAGALDNITVSVFETPPTIVSYSPDQAATGAYPAAPLVATFSNAITLTGAGSITIKDMAGTNDITINVTDPAQVSVSGTNLIITPPARLAYDHPFKVMIGSGTVTNFSTEPTDAQWTFTTAVQEFTAPVITLKNPMDGGLKVAPRANLIATFDQNITAGIGHIIIVDTDDNTTTRTIAVTDTTQVSFAGNVLTIDPTAPLTLGKRYAVQIAAGAVKNYSDIPFVGIPNSDVTTWNFAIIDPLKIMPMGDSITVGGTNDGWADPYWYGYRSVLYNLLHGAGYNFLFVGQSTDPPNPLPSGTTPPADLAALGQNAHNGKGGETVTYLNNNILTWLAADDPDVILLKVGTNAWDTVGLNTLVNTITTTKPNVHLIIAQIIPRYTYNVGTVNYNTYIRDTLVPHYQGLGKKVTLVDQYAPFLTNPGDLTSINQSLFSNGINHPTNVGYGKMAQVWLDGIKALGIGPEIFANWISATDFGIAPGDQGLNSDPDGDGISNGVENYFGTDPGKFSKGLVPVTANAGAGTFTFTHPLNPTRAENLTPAYRWSRDLSTFTVGGVGNDGSTVTFTQSAPSGGFVTVTATVTGAPLDKLFVDLRVTQN